jgi:hypothetical protein
MATENSKSDIETSGKVTGLKNVSGTPKSDIEQNQDDQDLGDNVDGKEHGKEHTRSKVAILFVLGFFAVIFLGFAYAVKVNASLSELKDTLIALIGALSGTLGFIVGYYYKSSQES